ncbi:MAG: HU family DNA-binding protein [Paludibacter sp.]
MSKDKISSQEMVEQIATKLSVSKRVAEEFLKSLFSEIEEALLKGESVKIKNLGTFKMQWNEPRKSVNVQTGEVIIIDGYNKVTFTPDSDLKEAVNEPYSHLEPVELDGQEVPSFEIEKPIIQTPETLRNLTEQASEIKDILSEIQSLSAKKQESEPIETAKPIETTETEIPEYDLILIDQDVETSEIEIEPEATPEVIITKPEVIVEPIISPYEPSYSAAQEPEKEEVAQTVEPAYYTENKETTKSNDTFSESTSEPFILGNKKKRKGLRFLIGFIVIILLIGGGIYATYFSSSCVRCWVEYDLLSETNRMKMNDYLDTFKGWFTADKKENKVDTVKSNSESKITPPTDTVNTPTDSVEINNDVPNTADSLQILFDSRREYNEYLGEEEISEGTRLTTIAQRYYGKKEFWVYIYEANRDNIVHPDRITPGTIVKVPRVDKRLIDKKNPRCLQKAKELHDLYVGKK